MTPSDWAQGAFDLIDGLMEDELVWYILKKYKTYFTWTIIIFILTRELKQSSSDDIDIILFDMFDYEVLALHDRE